MTRRSAKIKFLPCSALAYVWEFVFISSVVLRHPSRWPGESAIIEN